MRYSTAYKVNEHGFVFTASRDITEQELIELPSKYENTKLSWAEVGHYYVPHIKGEFQKDKAISYWEARNVEPPRYEDGTICNYKNYGIDRLNWDTVKWGNPRYPWEGPPLDSRFWKRKDGEWKQNEGWWEIHYPGLNEIEDITKYIPMWNHKANVRGIDPSLTSKDLGGFSFEEIIA
jgi:hypothetical protein